MSPTYADQRAIYLDDATPQVAGIYTNALVFHAARELARLYLRLGNVSRAKHWEERAASMRNVANALLWSDDAGFFRVHTLLRGAPSSDFDDSDVFAMGGNGLAALYGLATDEQAARIFASAEARRNEHGFTTIAATLLPAYPTDFFQHPILREAGSYQNGGQWDWFAGRFVLAEFQRGYAVAAQKHLLQLARRIVSHDGLYEWYTREDKPRGSAHYAGNAGALASAIFEGLFGIELRSDTVRLRVRLLDEPGEVDVSEPASGRRVFYRYLPGEGELELRLEANVSVDSLGVALPRGKRARSLIRRSRSALRARDDRRRQLRGLRTRQSLWARGHSVVIRECSRARAGGLEDPRGWGRPRSRACPRWRFARAAIEGAASTWRRARPAPKRH